VAGLSAEAGHVNLAADVDIALRQLVEAFRRLKKKIIHAAF
jgi:hypothetical protein